MKSDDIDIYKAETETDLNIPFHLTTSHNYRFKAGMTGQIPPEQEGLVYGEIKTLEAVNRALRQDCSSSLFTDHHRGRENWLSSSVLIVDIDNDCSQQAELWEQPEQWLTVEGFCRQFKDYEFILSTSLNHQLDKKERVARPKYHALFPLGQMIEDYQKISELYQRLDILLQRDDGQPRLDPAIKPESQIWGYNETQVTYNSGQSIVSALMELEMDDQPQPVPADKQARLQEFKQSRDYQHIIQHYTVHDFYGGVVSSSSRGGWIANCELHQDDQPSLEITSTLGFKCYACQASSYSALDYVAQREGITKTQARQRYQQQSSPTQATEYQVALGTTVDDQVYQQLQQLNQQYALVDLEGLSRIMSWPIHALTQQRQMQLMTDKDFRTKLNNRQVMVSQQTSNGGRQQQIWDLGRLWLKWSARRQYDGLDFYPHHQARDYGSQRIWDTFGHWPSASVDNDWLGDPSRRGLIQFLRADKLAAIDSLDQAQAGCDRYLQHLKDIICGNYRPQQQQQLYHYVVMWLASCLSNHLDRAKTALVLQGGQGSGKSTMVNLFGQLLGRHYLHLQDSGRLTERFNGYMRDILLLFSDESFWAGDIRSANTLKGMITEDSRLIEHKFQNPEVVPNFARLIFASNNDWIVSSDHDDRRFQVIEVSESKKQDRGYFTAIRQQWADGGKECLYYYLTSDQIQQQMLDFNFEKQRVRTPLAMQQLLNSNLAAAWIQEILDNGGTWYQEADKAGQWKLKEWRETESNSLEVNELYDDYLRYAKQRGRNNYHSSKNQLSRAVNQLYQSGYLSSFKSKVRVRDPHIDKNRTCWRFDSLQQLRQQWARVGYGAEVKEVFGSLITEASGKLPSPQADEVMVCAPTAEEEAMADCQRQITEKKEKTKPYSKEKLEQVEWN